MVFDSDVDEEERADLAQRVKQLQRDTEEGKQQWWAFCDAEGHSNRRDPNKHTVEFLRRFFSNRREGLIPAGRASLAPQNEPDPEMHKIWVQRVKQTQRSSPDMKARWEKYCDDHGGGVRDPQRHTSDYMRQFFDDMGGYTGQDAWAVNGCGGAAAGAWPQAQAGAYPYTGWTPQAAWADYYARCGYAMPGGVPGAMQPGVAPGQAQANGAAGAPGMQGFQQIPGMMPSMWGAPFAAPSAAPAPDEKEGKESRRARSRSRSRGRRKAKSRGRKGKRRRKSRSRSSSSSSRSSRR